MNLMNISSFARSQETAESWLKRVQEKVHLNNEEEAYVVLRAVLHTLRDRLTVNEAADFGAQLPLLLAGVYYNGWSPKDKPVKMKSKEEFVAHVADTLPQGVDPRDATLGTLNVIREKITEGEVENIKAELPKSIEQFWSANELINP
mgnify:CR=1 FL=1